MIIMEKEQQVNKLWYLSPIASFILSIIFSNPIIFIGLFMIWTLGVWTELKKRNRKIAKLLAIIDAVVLTIAFILNIYLAIYKAAVLIP